MTGVSRGIGAETTRLAAERGYAVCVNYLRNEDAAAAVVSGITRSGGRAVAVQGDVAVEADVVRLFETCDRELGPLAALVNNAGILERQMRVETFTKGLAQEVAEEGIRVNAVRPGFIYTDIHASGGEPDRIERVKVRVPMKRGGKVDEVAHAILWLLSDEASYTSGAVLDVAGAK